MTAATERSAPSEDLDRRLALVTEVMARSPDPLDVPFDLAYAPMQGDAYLAAWEDFARREGASTRPPDAVLYVHVPFCARVCSYCLLSSSRTPGKEPVDAYVRALRTQVGMFEPLVRPLRFSSLHIGGGTPSLLTEEQLDGLLGDLARFSRTDAFQIGIEAHPATTSMNKMRVLARHGVHRVSFGVESMTPEVLRNVNRGDQTADRVRAAVEAARACGLAVNVDLLAGLPGETQESFASSVRATLELEPDSMSVNRFLPENSPLGESGWVPSREEIALADRMLVEADRIIREQAPPRWPAEPLAAAGYGTQYVWDRSDRARAYFQQDMIGPSCTLALGHGGMGHVPGRFYSIAAGDVAGYSAALARGEPPAMLACPASERFEMAFFIADRVCRDALSPRDFHAVFGEDPRTRFGGELAFLVARGLLRQSEGRLRKPARRDFQVTHLLAFLALDTEALERARASSSRSLSSRGAWDAYARIETELPPSLLWCRMAIRASRASRGR